LSDAAAASGRFAAFGHELAWEARGQGRPLFFFHGLAADRRMLIAACEPLFAESSGARRIYVDLPGHGESRGDPAHAGADELVASLAALIRELAGDAPPALVGYSYGGYLALGLIGLLDPRPAGLFLVCPTVEADFGKRTVPPRRVALREPSLPFSDDPRERIAFEEVAVVQTRALLQRFSELVHPANIAADPELMAATRARYALSRPYMQSLAALSAPVGIVCGRDDHWVGFEDAIRLARAFGDVRYSVLPDAGHLLPLEQPARFAQLFCDWISRLG
jgi:pimeloyl-ACP methyl ester carboxylesterase